MPPLTAALTERSWSPLMSMVPLTDASWVNAKLSPQADADDAVKGAVQGGDGSGPAAPA